MKLLLLLFILPVKSVDVSFLRDLYQDASKEEAKAIQLLDIAARSSFFNPVAAGYEGAVKMVMAKYATNPYKKWNLFSNGKEILEAAISADPTSLELRYLRLTIQMNAPAILGYKSNINTDKKYLVSNINGVNDDELKAIIKNYLNGLKK